MTTYIILSRFSPEAFEDPKNFKELAAAVSAKIKKQCPDITWKGSFATLGRFDVVDLSKRRIQSKLRRPRCSFALTGIR